MVTSQRTAEAALFAVAGMALLGFIDNFVKLMAADIGLWQFHFARSAMVLGVFVPIALVLGWRVRPLRAGAVVFRSFFTATAMVFYFAAVAVLPIAQVGAGLFTAPIFVLIISAQFYGLPVGRWRVFAVALGFSGVLLLLRPEAGSLEAMSFVPILAGLFYGYGAVCTRVYCEGESTATLVTGFFLVLGLWGALGLTYFWTTGAVTDPSIDGFFGSGWQPWTGNALFWTVAQGLVSLLGLGCITRAYQIAEASRVAVFEYAFLISAGFWAYIFWNELPDALGLVGIALIVAAGVVIILRSREDAVA
ncbi:MAG: DMT family transporter [Litoreibacter sp.]|nr:DMT family transporter [Litoreibacter sp.]